MRVMTSQLVRFPISIPYGTHDDYRTLLTAIENGVNNNFAETYILVIGGKSRNFYTTPVFSAPAGDPVGISLIYLILIKLEWLGNNDDDDNFFRVLKKLSSSWFVCWLQFLHLTVAQSCDMIRYRNVTDRRTDKIRISTIAVLIKTR